MPSAARVIPFAGAVPQSSCSPDSSVSVPTQGEQTGRASKYLVSPAPGAYPNTDLPGGPSAGQQGDQKGASESVDNLLAEPSEAGNAVAEVPTTNGVEPGVLKRTPASFAGMRRGLSKAILRWETPASGRESTRDEASISGRPKLAKRPHSAPVSGKSSRNLIGQKLQIGGFV